MKNLKTTILSACIALCCLTNGNAQEAARGKNRGKVVTPGSQGSIVVFGGGTSMPSSDGKDKAFLSNSTAINADAFFSLISKPEANFSFGLNFGGAYNFGGSGGFGTTPNPFAVTGQTSSMVSDKGGSPIQAEFRMGAGPQANFYFGKFIVSPMVLGEYFSMTQKERSSVQTTQFNGQSYDFNLATFPETKTSGFAVTPKLRLHYMFNDRFGLFADASYTMGPKIETTVSKLIPNGNPSPQSGSYNIQQLQTGTMVKGETKSTAYSAMGFNFGVVIGLGSKIKNGSNNADLCTVCGQESWGGLDHPNCKGKANTDDIRKGWNGKLVDMVVPNTSGNNSNIENITIKGSGEYTDNGIPIVYGKIVTGNVKAANGKSNSSIAIKIEQKESNDIANAITDEKGNFSMELAQDTLHGISVNNVEYGKIKILDYPINSDKANTDDIRKGWNGLADAPEELEPTTPSNARTINNCCNATVTGSIIWDPTGTGIAASFVPATPSMSISMATVTATGGVIFNSTINCLTYSGCIDPTPIKYKVNGTLVGTSANTTNFTIPITAFSGPGSYTIKVIGTCGGSKCKAKTLQLIIF